MTTTTINDLQYAYRIHQQNTNLPDLLMLHGFMGDHRVFDHLIEALIEFCNPITVDLLGHGNSAAHEEPERYYEVKQVEDIRTIIIKLNSSSLWLYGYSMGGRLALKTALAHPELFNGLILESTNCGISDSDEREKRKQVDIERGKAMQNNYDKFLSEWKKLELFQSPLPTNETLVNKYHRIQSDQSPSALAASLKGFGSGAMEPVCDQLSTLELPTQLLGGSADKKYQKINSAMAKKLPDVVFSSVKAGHRIHLDNPSGWSTSVKSFLSRTERPD